MITNRLIELASIFYKLCDPSSFESYYHFPRAFINEYNQLTYNIDNALTLKYIPILNTVELDDILFSNGYTLFRFKEKVWKIIDLEKNYNKGEIKGDNLNEALYSACLFLKVLSCKKIINNIDDIIKGETSNPIELNDFLNQ